MVYNSTKQRVSNRGVPSDDFLDQLVAWGRTAPEDIFLPTPPQTFIRMSSESSGLGRVLAIAAPSCWK